jgi:hypothetical protein
MRAFIRMEEHAPSCGEGEGESLAGCWNLRDRACVVLR